MGFDCISPDHCLSFIYLRGRSWPEVIKHQLNEHEILNAHRYNNKKIGLFSDQINLDCYFLPLLNVKKANNCWHFNIYEQEKFHAQLS